MKTLKIKSVNSLVILFLLLLCVLPLAAQTQPTKLELGNQLERQIKGGETQEFQFKLKAGQFARVEVVPTNIDVIVSLFAPDGKVVIEMDGDSNYLWRESVSAISEKGGNYKLQIKGKGSAENSGNYTVNIAELRKSVLLDRKRIEAEQTLVEAIKFGQADKSKEAAKVYETSLNLWKEIGDKHWEAITMWNLAWAYFLSDRNDEAIKLHNQALLIFQELKDRIGEAGSISGIGSIYRWTEKYDLAKDYLEKALAIRIELKRLRSEYGSLNALILVYENLNLPDKILESLNRMLAISVEIKDRKSERDTLKFLGLFYYSKFDFEKAQPYLEQTLKIDRELKDTAGEIERLSNLATVSVYNGLNQPEKAKELLEQALQIARDNKDKKSEANILNDLGFFYNTALYNCSKGNEMLTQALIIKRELKDKDGEKQVLNNLITSNLCLGNNDKLIEYAEQGLIVNKELNDKAYQIDFLNSLANGNANSGQMEKAIELNEKALALAREEKKNSTSTSNFNYFVSKELVSLSFLANKYNSTQQFEKARELLDEALKIAREAKSNFLNLVLGQFADNYKTLKNYQRAGELYNEALDLARNTNRKDREVDNLHNLGNLFAAQGQFEKAQNYLEQALKIAQDTNNDYSASSVYSSIGQLYNNQNKYEQSIIYFEKGLILAQNSKNLNLENFSLWYLGFTYSKLYQYEKAIGYLELSLTKARESKNRVNEGLSLLALGDVYFKISDYEKARVYFEQVLKIAQESKHKWLLSFSVGGLGSVFSDLNNYQKAQGNFEQGLVLSKDVLDRSSEGNFLNSLGNTYLNLKEYEKAQSFYEQSLTVAKEVKDRHNEVYPLIGLGAVYLNKNQYTKSQDFYEQGLSLAREVKNRGSEGYALNGLGVVYFKLKKHKEAEDFYRQSLAIAKEVQSKKLEGLVLWNLMELHKELKKPQVAIVYGKQAIDIFQEVRGNIKSFEKESQQSYVKDKESAYRTLADLLISEGRFPEMQDVLNFLKEEEYSQLTRTDEKGETIPYADAEADLLEKIDNLIGLERQRGELLKIKRTDLQEKELNDLNGKIKEANAALKKALNKLATTEESVKKQIKEYYDAKIELKKALTNLQSENSGVVALYTLLGKEETAENKNWEDEKTKFGWVILVTEQGEKAYPIDVTNLNRMVYDFKDKVSSELYDPKDLAQKIYNAIFRQKSAKQNRTLEQDLEQYLGKYKNKTLMWSLDGVLRYIPMAALHDGKNYLVEKYLNEVFTEHSIGSLEDENNQTWKILGLGVSEEREGFRALPGAKKELEEIVREGNISTGILDGVIKLNGNFKKESFYNLISEGYPVIHIATHYSFKPTQQRDSFLLAGDGQLTFGEIIDKDESLFRAVDLLTLSACETGESGNGKEAEGFPIAAQRLGAKAVIASLWNVPDDGTPELMIQFYELRAANPLMSKGEAFRQAQLSLLYGNIKPKTKDKARSFSHPSYWSSFVLYGNWK